jgi:hypothetical protein
MSAGYLRLLMEDIQIALGYLRDLPDVRVDGVGLLGFCGGGVLKRKTAPFVLGRPSSVRWTQHTFKENWYQPYMPLWV